MNIIHKLKIKLSKESLARARKRIRNDCKALSHKMAYDNIFKGGHDGYKRERVIYDN